MLCIKKTIYEAVISKDVMREGTGEGFILLLKDLLVEKFQKVHFQIISQLTDLLLELEKIDPCAYRICKLLVMISLDH